MPANSGFSESTPAIPGILIVDDDRVLNMPLEPIRKLARLQSASTVPTGEPHP